MTDMSTDSPPAAESPQAPAAPRGMGAGGGGEGAGAGGPMGNLRGDLTQGPILKTLIAFTIPTMISNLLQTLNGTVNSIWVGRLIGESALAATANANVVMFLLFGAVFGFGMATTVRVGQHFGARSLDAARRSFGAGVGFCGMLAMVTGVLGWVFAPALLHALSTPEASRLEALAYLRVIFITMPFSTISLMVAMGMRGVGDARTPLHAMLLTVAVDIGLNPLLIRGLGPVPPLGIAGSALSTAIANFAGSALMIYRIYAKDMPLRLRGPELAYLLPSRSEISYVITKGLPMGAQMLVVSGAGLILIGLVNREGLNAAAAYGASLQLWNYLQMPAFALSSAVSAMVAQNVGAGNHGRVGRITITGVLSNLALTGALGLLIVAFARPLLVVFLGSQSPAVPLAQHIQLICTWSFVLMGITVIMNGTMRAYGEVVWPLVVIFLAMYPARLGFYFLAYPHIGPDAVWWTYPAGSAVSTSLTLLVYLRGGWRKRKHLAVPKG